MSALRDPIPWITLPRFSELLPAIILLLSPVVQAQSSLDFVTGRALFEKNWVPSPASTTASDGLGPYYNARSCMQCHPDGGRGGSQSRVIHVNDPVYGQQLQTRAVTGLPPEIRVETNEETRAEGRAEGREIGESGLTRLSHSLHDPAYGPLQRPEMSARIAPSLVGLSVLEAVPDSTILAMADSNDDNADGISGKVHFIPGEKGQSQVGRFGWKASQVTIEAQIARALSLDLGLGNPLLSSPYGDCTEFQTDCLGAADGNSPHHDNLEANRQVLDLLLTYVRGLKPVSRVNFAQLDDNPGFAAFRKSGCDSCHVPVIETGTTELHPFTDLLLHDMGPGLADGLVVENAAGSEWRTAPLLDLGRAGSNYLHDGRADSLQEAILWHDGEAGAAREKYLELEERERSDLIAFLNAL